MTGMSGGPLRAGRPASQPAGFRALNQPRPVAVTPTPDGEPASVTIGRQTHRVTAIQDRWRIDDLWWRQPLARAYFEAVLDDGRAITLYHDLQQDTWALQRYG